MPVKDRNLGRLIVQSIYEYGTKTIEDRVIPDYRDGLKPVQRRAIWALYQAKAWSSGPFKKKANIVGETMKYHPHGDAPISDALTNLVHDRYPLVEGYGGWGNPLYGEPAGAMRYIECRLSKLGESFRDRLAVTPLIDNYSGEYKEPLIFYSPLPFWLLNGGSGIAVAVSYSVPPHNGRQVFNLLKRFLKGNLTIEKAVEILGGPDYVQGGVLTSSKEELIELYKTGKGRLTFRCQYHYEEIDGKPVLVITSAAPGIKLNRLLEKLQELVNQNVLEFVQDVSSRSIRILVGITSRRLLEKKVLPLLRSSVNYNFAVTIRQPDGSADFMQVNLLEFLEMWVEHRRQAEDEFLRYQIEKEKERLWEIDLLLKALAKVEQLPAAVRDKDPVKALCKLLSTDERGANFILSRPLSFLTRQSERKLKEEAQKRKAMVRELEKKRSNIDEEILKAFLRYKDVFDERRTLLFEPEPAPPAIEEEGILCFKSNLSWWVEKKPGRAKAAYVASLVDPILVVTAEGRGRVFRYPDLQKIENYKKTAVAVVQVPENGYVALLDDQGKLLVLKSSELSSSTRERQLFKPKGRVCFACPIPEGTEELIAVTPRGKRPINLQDFIGRLGSTGKKLRWKSVVKVLPYLEDEVLVLQDGRRLTAALDERADGIVLLS